MLYLFQNSWTDYNNNQWSANIYTKEEAEELHHSLWGCTNCVNCKDCMYCAGCINCTGCTTCVKCKDCVNCYNCLHRCNTKDKY